MSYGAGDAPQAVAIGDFDGDGRSDLAVANFDSSDVSVLRGIGDGTFAAALTYATGPGTASVTVADLDDNTRQDLVVANANGDLATVLLNTSACATLTSLAPSAGPAVGGQIVAITGLDLTTATAVTFGGSAAPSFTIDSATQITATTPAHAAGIVDVEVTWSGGTAFSPVDYTYVAAPTIDSVAPNAGPLGGGQTVTITGTVLTGATSVTFGGTAATSFTVDSATQITAMNPAHAAGSVSVEVTTIGGSASATYTYASAPTIDSVSPDSGPLGGGQIVTITGANLTGATSVMFGGAAAGSFTVDSPTQITATTPANAPGALDVVVSAPGGSATASGGYTYASGGHDPHRQSRCGTGQRRADGDDHRHRLPRGHKRHIRRHRCQLIHR